MKLILILVWLLCLPALATARPDTGLLPGPLPNAWRVERDRQSIRREVRRELRRGERHRQRHAWHRYERPSWRQIPTVRRHGRAYRLEPVPRQRNTQ